MFDEIKLKQLQNKSHVRGKLNKQFYSQQQEQLERKRRQMKQILDQQVQQKRKQKEKQKFDHQRKIQIQQQKIKAYYMQIQQRQRKPSNSNNSFGAYGQLENSNVHNKQSGKVNGSGVYQSRTIMHDGSHSNGSYNQHIKENITESPNPIRSKSRTQHQYDFGDIPVMPLMQSPQKDKQKNHQNSQNINNSGYQKMDKQYMVAHRSSAGNIPLLQLTQDQQKKQKKKSKRNPTKRDEKQKQKFKQKERRPTLADEQHLLPNSRQRTQFKQVFGDLNEQIEQENKELKKQLKKKEEAISLLMGAVRSNAKLDKFRIQAQKILHGQNSLDAKIVPITQQSRARKQSIKDGHDIQQTTTQKQSMLPRLKLHHQSMMHDYMFGSARRANMLKARTFK